MDIISKVYKAVVDRIFDTDEFFDAEEIPGISTSMLQETTQAAVFSAQAQSRPSKQHQPAQRCPLLELPDPALDKILQCCGAADLFSLLSAASAHSQLHQAAKTVSIIRAVLPNQQKVDGLLKYLGKYGQELESIEITARRSDSIPNWRYNIFLNDLPHEKLQKLRSLSLSNVFLQLQPGVRFQGVLGLGTDLTQLQLNSCKLSEDGAGLTAALAQLSDLKSLSIYQIYVNGFGHSFDIPALPLLQRLTHLELSGDKLQDADGLHNLEGLTGLKHLRLIGLGATIRASYLSGLQDLTYLEVMAKGATGQQLWPCSSTATSGVFEPGALAGKTALQHIQLLNISIPGGAAGVAELLFHIQHVMRLKTLTITDLNFSKPSTHTPRSQEQAITPAAPLVTLSSRPQRLYITGLSVPADTSVWEVVFPIGRQFPHLQALKFNLPWSDGASWHTACLGTRSLVSCCPRLQSLTTPQFAYSAGELAVLSELSSLHELSMIPEQCLGHGVPDVTAEVSGRARPLRHEGRESATATAADAAEAAHTPRV